MTDTITVIGLVATTPRHIITGDRLPITTFRLASTQRKFDRTEKKWVDGETNWYTITSFRQLAGNVVGSVQKGQRVIVTGRLRIRDWATDEKKGTNVEVDAEALGHDLTWGSAVFTRSASAKVAEEVAEEGGEQGASGGDEREAGDHEATRIDAIADAGESNEDPDGSRPAVLIDEPEAALPF